MPNNNNIPVCADCVFFDDEMSLCCNQPPEPNRAAVIVASNRVMCREYIGRNEFLEDEDGSELQ